MKNIRPSNKFLVVEVVAVILYNNDGISSSASSGNWKKEEFINVMT